MPRFNKIFAGPATEPMPQVVEAPAADAAVISPGHIIKLASGEFVLSGAGTDNSKMFVAQDNYLALKGVDDVLSATSGDLLNATVIGLEMLPGQLFNVRLAASQTIVKGALLMTTTAGTVTAATGTGARVIAIAEEDLTTTASVELIRVRAAGNHVSVP